jgi:ribose/xylose/arabinose/galactoside ABC-type transport system permease subunit
MQATLRIAGIALLATLAVAACNRNKTPELMNVRSQTRGPDEFGILPTKPLQLPEDIAALPEPTPGGTNITDPTPEADAVAALGGNPEAVVLTGAPTRDGGLITYAARFGVAQDIRGVLAAEDLEWRRKNDGRLLERVFNVNVYYKAYKRMSLDQHLELERWRKLGIKNVGAPPDPEVE